MKDNKDSKLICSYCGEEYSLKSIKDLEVLLFKSGIEDNIRICTNCAKACVEKYNKVVKLKQDNDKSTSLDEMKLTPVSIKEYLDTWVINQDKAKVDVATGIYNHYKRLKRLDDETVDHTKLKIDKSNMVLLGPTGSGKTQIVKSLAELLDLPYVIEDAQDVTSAGLI